jgi:hypothetical protein
VINYHPGILEIGLTETLFASDPAPGTTDHMVAEWFRSQIAGGNSVDAEVSAGKLARIAAGEFDGFSGRYLTAYDDFDVLVGKAHDVAGTEWYTLGLLAP